MRLGNLFFTLLLVGCLGSTAQAQVGYGPGSLSPAPLRGMPGIRNQPGRSGIMSGAIVVQPGVVQTPEPVPADAKALLDVFDAEAAAIRAKAEQEIQIRRQTLIFALQALQDAYTVEPAYRDAGPVLKANP
ncbi:MAG: hypothetical protein JSS49_03710 [Planctomycetes bacterium]|nr:hypothetical protein [Planctomycetota bacterium]